MKNQSSLSDFVFGKVQPQAVPLEEAVLGALMLDREAYHVCRHNLTPERFYLEAHQHIYRAIERLVSRSAPVDLLTVTEELKNAGDLDKIGGGDYLVELSNRVASAANIEYHSFIIRQKSIQRELIAHGITQVRDAHEDLIDPMEVWQRSSAALAALPGDFGGGSKTLAQLEAGFHERLRARLLAAERGEVIGVPSGFFGIDALTGGWQNSDLICVAARPGMGKTAFVVTAALNAAFAGKKVQIFSLEMADWQLYNRITSALSEVHGDYLRSKLPTDEMLRAIEQAQASVRGLDFRIDDTSRTCAAIGSVCAQRARKEGIDLVVVDYLQIVSFDGSKFHSREQEVAEMSKYFKRLAKSLNVPVIMLSQLSRAVEARGGAKRPILSDLRESGAIEQDCDLVAFLYRPEYYGIKEDENGQSLKGVAEFIVAKHRNGGLDAVSLKFNGGITKFDDADAETVLAKEASFPTADHAPAKDFSVPNRRTEDEIPF